MAVSAWRIASRVSVPVPWINAMPMLAVTTVESIPGSG
jgi:hypothetical protein